jgi:hypothetical protein
MEDKEILKLKIIILNMTKELNSNSFLDKNIVKFIDACYKLNSYLNNDFFDTVLYDIKLKYDNNYDNLYIFENIEKIENFVNVLI